MAKIFTPEFNQFETINATQAWSLFFTISASDRLLGEDPAVGRYITLALFSAILTEILNVLLAL
jgi:topoisomerase IA-like protein